jgi:hypothetical protein
LENHPDKMLTQTTRACLQRFHPCMHTHMS